MILAVESTWSFGYARIQTLDCKIVLVIILEANTAESKGVTRAAPKHV